MSGHEPQEHAVHTDTVECAQNGVTKSPEYEDMPCATLADLEAFCAKLRSRGAPDDLVIPAATSLSATVELP